MHMQLENIKDSTNLSPADFFTLWSLEVRGYTLWGFRDQLPYLRSHSANGG